MELLSKPTRFRAYQLGISGSSFSYFDGKNFYLIEAMLTDISEHSLVEELYACGKNKKIDVLHITSWDNDHCSPESLKKILSVLKPNTVYTPGYNPDTLSGKESIKIINSYINSERIIHNLINIEEFTPAYVTSRHQANSFEYTNVVYNPSQYYQKKNDNSSIMLFRTGCFTIASLGDVESENIAKSLLGCKIFRNEIDVMVLAHHGADNGFTTDDFIKSTKPSVAICTSNFDSQFEHPRQEIRDILYENNVDLYTTKTGDVVIESIEPHTIEYLVTNLKANSTEISKQKSYITKREKKNIIENLIGI